MSYGRLLPKDFIPSLSDLTPILEVKNNKDSMLPQIDGFCKEKITLIYHNLQVQTYEK